MKILKGKKAQNVLKFILDHDDFTIICVMGFFKRNLIWVAFDNSTFDCNVEEFKTKRKAKKWLKKYLA